MNRKPKISHYHIQGNREYQEDRFVILENFANNKDWTLIVVCDGHGGQAAVNYLIQSFPKELSNLFIKHVKTDTVKDISRRMEQAFELCVKNWDEKCFGDKLPTIVNQATKEEYYKNRPEEYWQNNDLESGCTIVSVLINLRDNYLHVLNVGDSRAAWIWNECKKVYTNDHIVPDYMEPIEGYKFTYGDGYLQDDLNMSRSFGDNTCGLFRIVKRTPDIIDEKFYSKGLRLIIATDGLWDTVTIEDALNNKYENAEALAKKITDLDDNITIIYVDIPSTIQNQEMKSKPRTLSPKKQKKLMLVKETNNESKKTNEPYHESKKTPVSESKKSPIKDSESKKIPIKVQNEKTPINNESKKTYIEQKETRIKEVKKKPIKNQTFEEMLASLDISKTPGLVEDETLAKKPRKKSIKRK